jgi:hypothetical protein
MEETKSQTADSMKHFIKTVSLDPLLNSPGKGIVSPHFADGQMGSASLLH